MNNEMQDIKVDTSATEEDGYVMPLVDRLRRCQSKKGMRETIADYCEEIGVSPENYQLTSEERDLFASMKS